MAILNAIFLPGADNNSFYPQISPINTFIVLVNCTLGSYLPLLEDKSYGSTWDHPYDFIRFDPDGNPGSASKIRKALKKAPQAEDITAIDIRMTWLCCVLRMPDTESPLHGDPS